MQISDLAYIDSTGYHFADYPSFLSWLQTEYRTIYGEDVYLENDSQDGQFLAILAKAFYDTAALGASVYNSFSPVTAQGVGLARNVKINGLTKGVPTKSTVEVTIVGQASIVIGTVGNPGIAIDTLGQKWLIPIGTTIPGPGTVVATAVAEFEGAVTADANTVNSIFTPTLGWQSVNNLAAATPGAPVEPDATLRIRQANSTADPSLTVLEGTVGGVSNLTGVTKVRAFENDTGSTDSNGVPAHTIAVGVLGGDDVAIAQEIALHKTPGTRTFGNTTETVYDAHGMPLDIHFNRPVTATISGVVTLSANAGWSVDYVPLIQAAVAAVINSVPIGGTVLITKLYAPAYLIGTPAGLTFDVGSITIAKNGGMQGTTNIVLTYNENPVCVAATDITVTVT